MKSDSLKNFLEWNKEVIEAAETPFAKLAGFVLPILAPIVPAFITSIGLYEMFVGLLAGLQLILSPEGVGYVAVVFSAIISLVLELLGYVGTISIVRFIFRWIKEKSYEYLVPTAMVVVAYVFYLGAMYSINVQLHSESPNQLAVLGLLSFMSVPAGLIFAVNVNETQEVKKEDTIRQEKREDGLKRLAIKKGINIFEKDSSPVSNQDVKPQTPSHEDNQKRGDWRTIPENEKRDIRFKLSVDEIMRKYKVGRSTAFSWKNKNV